MQSMLSRQAFEAAAQFIQTRARPLEAARFRHEFSDEPAEAVLECLAAYQNADGGFGNALEPDLRTRASSALCTSIACQMLRTLPGETSRSLRAASVAYLWNTLDTARGCWRMIPRLAQQSPHAPWWDQTNREAVFDAFSLNPTAEILGYLFDEPSESRAGILSLLGERVMQHLATAEKIEMHELLCCLRLLRTKTLPLELSHRLRPKLAELIRGTVAMNPAQWTGYCLRPLQVVDSPGDAFMEGLEPAVAANLDFEISSQNPDGSWTPPWSWGKAFPDDWAQARREWMGWLTLEKLRTLRRFNRIEGF